jgi:membrane peptidoglycan carboxypeptidase
MALIFNKFATASVAYSFSGDLIEFFTILRSVYSTVSELRNPLNFILPSLILTPIIQFFTVLMVFRAIRVFFATMNRRYPGCYSEADSLFFGLLCIFVLVVLDISLFAQSSYLINNVAQLTFVGLSKLIYPIYFFTLSHINLLNRKDYHQALEKYLIMTQAQKKINFTPILFILFSFLIGIILLVPFHFGLQALDSNKQVILIFLMVCATAGLLFHFIFVRGWNFLGTVLSDTNFRIGEITDNLYRLPVKVKKVLRVIFLIAALLFSVFYWDLALMALLFALIPILLAAILSIIIYLIGLITKNLHDIDSLDKFNETTILNYFLSVSKSISKALLPCSIFIFTVFMLLSVFPKDFKYKNPHIVKSLIDKDNNVIYADIYSKDDFCIPLGYNDIPEFTTLSIINQEDRNFALQNDWKPNLSNFHGFSISFLSKRGGSNILNQLVKNQAFEKFSFPQDISRKLSESICSYMLSNSKDKNDIMAWYINSICFNGGKGHVGLEAASLKTFGKSVNRLNHLEQLYLVATLPRSEYIVSKSGSIYYYDVIQNFPNEVKEILIDKATKLYDKGLLTRKQLNILKRDTLHFTNGKYKSFTQTSTRLFLEKQTEGYPEAKYITTISQRNLQKMQAAYTDYATNRYFPPALQKDGCTLYTAALAINYRTGEIISHYTNHDEDLTSFGAGYSMSSTVKPFVLLQLLEEGVNPIRLYDGKIGNNKTPSNSGRAYTNTYLDVNTILARSLNAPLVNIRQIVEPQPLYKHVEDNFEKMDIAPKRDFADDTYNYPIGSRPIQVYELAQIYQCLFNDGVCKKLHCITGKFSPQTNTVESLPVTESKQVYHTQNTSVIKEALTHTLTEGTATHLQQILPEGAQFYIKTGTSNNGANHGFTVFADDNNLLIVVFVSYGKIVDGTLVMDRNKTLPIPYGSGGKSAGVFAAYIYNQLIKE